MIECKVSCYASSAVYVCISFWGQKRCHSMSCLLIVQLDTDEEYIQTAISSQNFSQNNFYRINRIHLPDLINEQVSVSLKKTSLCVLSLWIITGVQMSLANRTNTSAITSFVCVCLTWLQWHVKSAVDDVSDGVKQHLDTRGHTHTHTHKRLHAHAHTQKPYWRNEKSKGPSTP